MDGSLTRICLFAIGFGAPGLLWGAGLAATPIILHLLFRRKYRQIDWAAMKWLLDAMKKNHRRLRMEQWLLLAIRTLLILLIVSAMAKPTLETASPLLAAASSSAVHNVLVFDNSMSMHYSSGNQTRWDRAKGLAQAVLDDAQKGDLASLVVMGMPSTAVVGDASPYLVSVSEEIDAIEPEFGTADVESAVDLVAQILQKSSVSRKRVYMITDLQRRNWITREEQDQNSELGRKLRSISEVADFVILDVGAVDSSNLAVTDVQQTEPVVVARRGATIRAEVANFSQGDQAEAKVELLVDGQVEGTQRIELPAGERRVVNFATTFNNPGDRVVEVRLEADALAPDNTGWLVARVRNSISALLIDGQPSGEPFRSETDYLRVAMQPQDTEADSSLIHAEVKLESDLLEAKLDDWDLVALCNVSQLTPSEVSVLEAYLRRGGGVLFFLGPQTNVAAFNEMLFADSKGILPVELGGTAGGDDKEKFFRFDPLEYAHPLVAPFRDHEQAGLLSAKTFRYLKAELPPDSAAQVALAFDTKDPAIVVAPYGGGYVGVVTTTADLEWNAWPISPSYVPIVQELALQLVAGRVTRRQFRVGETLSVPAPVQLATPPTLQPPDPKRPAVPLRVQQMQGMDVLTYDDTGRPGVYRIQFDSGRPEWGLAVNTWPEEGDLTRITTDDLRTAFPGFEFHIASRFESPRSITAGSTNRSAELHRLLLYAAMALLFAETYFAWKFGHHTVTSRTV